MGLPEMDVIVGIPVVVVLAMLMCGGTVGLLYGCEKLFGRGVTCLLCVVILALLVAWNGG